jgi:peroxiredoxin
MNRIYITLFLLIFSLNLFSQMRPGQNAADLSLPDLNGKTVSLSEFKGKVVLLDFWASWCGPCRHNNPRLVKLYNKFHDKGFEIYGVSLDEDTKSWKKAVRNDKLSWTQVIDDKGWDATSIVTYGINFIPSSFLIDRDGVIRTINAEGPELESSVKDLLKD